MRKEFVTRADLEGTFPEALLCGTCCLLSALLTLLDSSTKEDGAVMFALPLKRLSLYTAVSDRRSRLSCPLIVARSELEIHNPRISGDSNVYKLTIYAPELSPLPKNNSGNPPYNTSETLAYF